MKRLIIITVLALLLVGNLFAQVAGRINGTVKDEKTGEPLPGANVVIQGTKLGAATDAKGEYNIVNVPPGTYTLEAKMVGYKTAITKNVAVKVNLTTHLDFLLEATSLDLGEPVVVAERALIASEGRSQFELKGIVIDAETGKGIEGARVIISVLGDRLRGGETKGAETDKKGEFIIRPVYGVFDIRVRKQGYEAWSDTEVPFVSDGKQMTIKLEKEKPIQTKVFSIKYKDPMEIRQLIGPLVFDDGSTLSRTITHNTSLRTITVRARADVLAKIEELIYEYDIPPTQIRLDIQLVLADNSESTRQLIPKELEPIQKKLSDLFKYKNYSLVGSANTLVYENESCQIAVGGSSFRVSIGKIEYLINAGIIKLSRFQLEGKEAHLSTTVNVSDGDTVIIGKASTGDPRVALITIVKAEVVE